MALVVVIMVGKSIAENSDRFRSLDITLAIKPGWVALSLLSLVLVSALQIESWRRILAGWAQSLPFAAAARIWFLANLGRYVPGKVWSVAGMVVLAQHAGIQGWAAAASAVAVQALGLGTAVVLVAAATPSADSPLRLGLAALAALATIALLAWKGSLRTLGRLVGSAAEWRALPVGPVLVGSALTLLSWVAYGVAFWLLSLGLGLPGALPLPTAAGVFALGYILGLLAFLVPGGVGVRELVYIGLLTPYLGSGGAVALSLASRLELTLTEAAAGLGALLLGGRKETEVIDSPQP